MRASDRCKAVKNGDRCRKARGHDSDLLIGAPDEVHEGANQRWGRNFTEEKFPLQRAKNLKEVSRLLKKFTDAKDKRVLPHVSKAIEYVKKERAR